MFDTIAKLLPTNLLNSIRDAAFDELKSRGEIVQSEPHTTAERGESFLWLGLRIKIVEEKDFSHWYVYAGDADPIHLGVSADNEIAFSEATTRANWYLSGAWRNQNQGVD